MSTCKRMWTDREIRSMAVDSVEKKTNLKVFENIVDKDGHKRFIEGDVNIETIEGVTKTYGKWSLSGSHLMLALCIAVADETSLSAPTKLATISIPEWIGKKINTLASAYIDRKYFNAVATTWGSQNLDVSLTKVSNFTLDVHIRTAITMTANREARIQFDLLIDNE